MILFRPFEVNPTCPSAIGVRCMLTLIFLTKCPITVLVNSTIKLGEIRTDDNVYKEFSLVYFSRKSLALLDELLMTSCMLSLKQNPHFTLAGFRYTISRIHWASTGYWPWRRRGACGDCSYAVLSPKALGNKVSRNHWTPRNLQGAYNWFFFSE